MSEKRDRCSNFELLRIVGMVSILCGHYVTKGGMVYSDSCIAQKVSLIFWGGGKLGVSVFALITGYFATGKEQKNKIIKIWTELLFFSLISLLLYIVFDNEAINFKMVVQTFLQVSMETWWYMSIYIFILALAPFIYKIISTLSKEEYCRLLQILLVGFTVIPTFIYKANPYFSNLGWLIVLYILGYYLNKYDVQFNPYLSLIISICLIWISELVFERYENIETNYFVYMYRAPMLVAAVSLVLIFKKIKMNKSQLLNKIASGILGVYLLHDGLFLRTHWYKFIRTEKVYGSWLFVMQMIVNALLLFALGWMVDCVFKFLYSAIQSKMKNGIEK